MLESKITDLNLIIGKYVAEYCGINLYSIILLNHGFFGEEEGETNYSSLICLI